MSRCGKRHSLADFLPVNRDRLVERDIKAACDKSGHTSLRAAARGSLAGHRRDTGRPQKNKPLKFLALPKGTRTATNADHGLHPKLSTLIVGRDWL